MLIFLYEKFGILWYNQFGGMCFADWSGGLFAMYQIGEYVVYGVQGICRVLGKEKQLVNRKRVEYLVLEPLTKGESKFYLPTQNPAAMAKLQPLLSLQALNELLLSDEIRQGSWVPEENLRKQRYRELLSGGDRVALLQMLRSVYRYREELEASGKKIHQCDDNFLRDAEKLICCEISLVMILDTEQAKAFLRNHLSQ